MCYTRSIVLYVYDIIYNRGIVYGLIRDYNTRQFLPGKNFSNTFKM